MTLFHDKLVLRSLRTPLAQDFPRKSALPPKDRGRPHQRQATITSTPQRQDSLHLPRKLTSQDLRCTH